jgi:hypothetical protein
MKKLCVIMAVTSLVIVFSQCKKTKTVLTDEGIHIILAAGYGNGERTAFEPTNSSFVWTNGTTEYIYVGGNEHTGCLGVLSGIGTGANSMTFDGTLTSTPNDGETLHFFYLGKGKDGSAISTLDFSTQDGTLANVTDCHIAIGSGTYSNGTINYATTLEMAMSIAYFDVSGFKNTNDVSEIVYLHGEDVFSTATVDYQNGVISGSTKGYIDIGKSNAGKYVAMIPSVQTATVLKFDSNSKTGEITFNRGVQAGKYYVNGSEALSVTANNLPEGTATGLFSVSSTKKVRFSKGNLQYIGSATIPYWKFADNQWDCFRQTTGQSNDNTSPDIDRDLFAWGTSGYNHGALYYQPYQINGTNNCYYPYGNQTGNLYDQTGKADWGYNAILNGGNEENIWHTPSSGDYSCLLIGRTTVSGSRFVLANVANTNGLIIFPDDWDNAIHTFNNINKVRGEAYYEDNIVSEEEWNNTMEINGTIFLPAAGRTGGFNEQRGNYWESDFNKLEYGFCFANAMHFQFFQDTEPPTKNIDVQYGSVFQFCYSVRLVREVE